MSQIQHFHDSAATVAPYTIDYTANHFNGSKNNYLYNNLISVNNKSKGLNDGCYIIKDQTLIPVVKIKTVFKSTTAIPGKPWIHPKPLKESVSTDLLIFPFAIGFLCFVAVFVRYAKYLAKFFEAFIYSYVVEKLVDDLNVPLRRMLLLLDTVSLFALSFIVYHSVYGLGIHFGGAWGVLLLFAAILGSLFVYRLYFYIVHWIVRVTLNIKDFTSKLLFDSLLVFRLGGLVLLPIALVIFYSNDSIAMYAFYASIIILVFLYLYRLFRLLTLFIKNGISFLYYILYLCALEIVPAILLYVWAQAL